MLSVAGISGAVGHIWVPHRGPKESIANANEGGPLAGRAVGGLAK
jgi:hypothetical protein